MKLLFPKLNEKESTIGGTPIGCLMDHDIRKDVTHANKQNTSQSINRTISSKGQVFRQTYLIGGYMLMLMVARNRWDVNRIKEESEDLCLFVLCLEG